MDSSQEERCICGHRRKEHMLAAPHYCSHFHDNPRCDSFTPSPGSPEPDTVAEEQLEALRKRVAELEYWNSAVAVCRDHVDFIVSVNPGDCAICDLDERDEQLEALRRENERLREALEADCPTPESLRAWADWFDRPDVRPVVFDPGHGKGYTAGYLLRRFAETLEAALTGGTDD